ncbi:PAS domain-containing sensor histidine kinase [Salinibacter ruber]|uniref:PAS domain-containing sensor histidine kinase n=2 Tax=Salinibacter ruber TaxID=146919 RepID=UPI0021696747|nr:PAS domain S-box protein [Salinibacter ruber]MCS3645888.1 PAS domain S-box-containing protein [Salinibacter ruber]
MPSPARNITALLWPSDDMLSTNAKSRLQVVRLLCLLGSLLIPLYGLLYEAARPEATDPMWIRLVIAGVLGAFVAGTYVLRTLRTHCVGVAWGLLYLLMAWSVALAAVNQFSGAYVVGMLVVYAVSATLVLVSSQLLRSVLSFLSAGLLLTGAALLWAPAVQLSPLVLCGGMAMVAFVVGVVARWVLRVRRHLADQARELEEQRDRLEGHRAYTNRLLNATDDLFFALDPTGQFQWWNDRVLETTGLSDEDVGSVDALDHFVPAEREKQAKQAIRRVLQTGSGQVEVPLVADDGVAVPYEFVGNPVENLEGERQIVCVGRNVAERKRRERELRESERRFQAMLNDPNILAGVLSPDGTFQKVNDTALGYIEATRADVLGRPFWETPWWETENRSAVREKVERVAEGEYVRFEAEHVTPDGEARTVTGIMRPVTGEEGEVVSIFVTARDITERKRKARRLKQAKEQAELSKLEAEEASRMKSAMLANMSHEIRTPLTGIIGFAEAIGDEIDGDGGVAHFADLIEDSGRRLLDTLDAVLNLSKLEAGQMTLASRPIDLADQARQVAWEFAAEADESGLALEVEAEEAGARADEGGLQIVLQNLLSNAIKYTEEGTVQVRTYREDGEAVLQIEDTGIGMDPAVADSLFEPFRQGSEGLSREYEGTGIGLAVTKKATEQMGGSIDVETEKGQGSTFTARLPAADRKAKRSATDPNEKKTGRSDRVGG